MTYKQVFKRHKQCISKNQNAEHSVPYHQPHWISTPLDRASTFQLNRQQQVPKLYSIEKTNNFAFLFSTKTCICIIITIHLIDVFLHYTIPESSLVQFAYTCYDPSKYTLHWITVLPTVNPGTTVNATFGLCCPFPHSNLLEAILLTTLSM